MWFWSKTKSWGPRALLQSTSKGLEMVRWEAKTLPLSNPQPSCIYFLNSFTYSWNRGPQKGTDSSCRIWNLRKTDHSDWKDQRGNYRTFHHYKNIKLIVMPLQQKNQKYSCHRQRFKCAELTTLGRLSFVCGGGRIVLGDENGFFQSLIRRRLPLQLPFCMWSESLELWVPYRKQLIRIMSFSSIWINKITRRSLLSFTRQE